MNVKLAVLMSLGMVSTAQADALWQLGEGRIEAGQLSPAGVSSHNVTFSTELLLAGPRTLDLQLPAGDGRFVLTDTTPRAKGALWQGHLTGQPDHKVQLTQHRGMLAGMVSVPGAIYEIIPVDIGQSALVRIQHDLYPACSGAVHPEPGAVADSGAAAASLPEGSSPAHRDRIGDIDVLIVYTTAARVGAGGVVQMETTAQAAVDNSNASFVNSNMVTRFTLVGTREIEYAESGSSGTDLSWLRDNTTIQGWRNQTLADMTGLITENGGGGCGIGYVLTSLNPGFESHAVQVTARSCAVGNLTYAHEHGHNMAMHHNPESASGASIAPDAYGHWDNTSAVPGERFRTVMSYACPTGESCTRRMYFSNPNIAFMGRPTGITGQRNNARVGNHVADLVANFRTKTILRHGFD